MSLRPRLRLQLAAAATLAVVTHLCGVSQALADSPDPAYTPTIAKPTASGQVTAGVDAQERTLSLYQGIRIADDLTGGLNTPRVVYSVYLPGLDQGPGSQPEDVQISTTVYSSYCIATDRNSWPCSQLNHNPDYQIRLKAYVYKAESPTDTVNSDTANAIIDKRSELCWDEKHHCPVVISGDYTGLASSTCDAGEPCNDYVNVEIVAWTPSSAGNWQPGDMVALEGDCVDPTKYQNCDPQLNDGGVEDTKGQLGLVRFGTNPSAAKSATVSHTGTNFTHARLPICDDTNCRGPTANCYQVSPPPCMVVVYSKALYNLKAGDVIETDAQLHAEADNYPTITAQNAFHHALTGYWILTADQSRIQPNPAAGSNDRYVSPGPFTSVNCIDGTQSSPDNGTCDIHRVGTVTVPSTASPIQSPMYLNYVVQAKILHLSNTTSNYVQLSGGTFDKSCHPQPTDPLPVCAF
jgi:hypothetical protein